MESHDFLWYLAVLSLRSKGLACLAWLALRGCRIKSASAKHAVWTVVTAVMLTQVFVTPGLPPLPIRVLAPATDIAPTPRIIVETFPTDILNSYPPTRRIPSWKQIVIGVYTAVAFALLVQLAIGYFFARRLVRNSKPVDGSRLRESESISVPVTVGQIVPKILFPMGWREWDSAKLQAVLTHEEAHVRRGDWAIGVMARINCCVFWFHPLSWWLKRELALLAEYACDDLALTQIGNRRQYARALLEIAYAMKSAEGRFWDGAVPMAKETNVKKRMEQILDETRTIPPAVGRRGWITLLVCSMPLAYFASTVQLAPAQTKTVAPVVSPASAPAPTPEPARTIAQARPTAPKQVSTQTPPAPATAASPFRKWLDEEVVYIISVDEQRAFLRYATDDERQQFITQFWLRRDPTPGTEENEMKEEHYRRIAYANDRFSVGIPGWQTDRGMIYIKHGPPDAIDSHGATLSTYPYESWQYRDTTGIGTPTAFEFVDPTMTGRYHLTRDPTERQR